jgi:hypothetical protein
MSFHGLPERTGIHRPVRIHRIIQCPDGQEIAVCTANRRAGTCIRRFPGTVYSLEFPARQFTVRRDICRELSPLAGYIVENPVGARKPRINFILTPRIYRVEKAGNRISE